MNTGAASRKGSWAEKHLPQFRRSYASMNGMRLILFVHPQVGPLSDRLFVHIAFSHSRRHVKNLRPQRFHVFEP